MLFNYVNSTIYNLKVENKNICSNFLVRLTEIDEFIINYLLIWLYLMYNCKNVIFYSVIIFTNLLFHIVYWSELSFSCSSLTMKITHLINTTEKINLIT